MTLENIYYIGQTVAVIAILASLGAIWGQMRQANRLAKLETTRAIWMDAGARVLSQVEDAEKTEFLQRALFGAGDLTDAEKTRLYLTLASLFITFENGFAMHESKMMSEGFWPRMRDSMRDYIAPARAQRWWRLARMRTFAGNPEFVAEVDAVIAELDQKAAD
ncbi:MAG: hypothetical protein AAFW81_01090 [Pseudomonadota bacterium]